MENNVNDQEEERNSQQPENPKKVRIGNIIMDVVVWLTLALFSAIGTFQIYSFIFRENRAPDLADEGDFAVLILLVPFLIIAPFLLRMTARAGEKRRTGLYYVIMALTTSWSSVIITDLAETGFSNTREIFASLMVATIFGFYIMALCWSADAIDHSSEEKDSEKKSNKGYIVQIILSIVLAMPVAQIVLSMASPIVRSVNTASEKITLTVIWRHDPDDASFSDTLKFEKDGDEVKSESLSAEDSRVEIELPRGTYVAETSFGTCNFYLMQEDQVLDINYWEDEMEFRGSGTNMRLEFNFEDEDTFSDTIVIKKDEKLIEKINLDGQSNTDIVNMTPGDYDYTIETSFGTYDFSPTVAENVLEVDYVGKEVITRAKGPQLCIVYDSDWEGEDFDETVILQKNGKQKARVKLESGEIETSSFEIAPGDYTAVTSIGTYDFTLTGDEYRPVLVIDYLTGDMAYWEDQWAAWTFVSIEVKNTEYLSYTDRIVLVENTKEPDYKEMDVNIDNEKEDTTYTRELMGRYDLYWLTDEDGHYHEKFTFFCIGGEDDSMDIVLDYKNLTMTTTRNDGEPKVFQFEDNR